MQFGDIVNGGFELSGTFFLCLNIRQLLKDKQVKGVHWLTVLFFTFWGYWNIYYYPSLGQWVSFIGGVGISITNSVFVMLLYKYSRRK